MKILVVEDDCVVAQSLQFLLSSYNYAVDIATSGGEALRLADAFEYHLVLLDVLLPQLSGIEVCRQLRKKGFRQPILLLTGQGETQQKANTSWSVANALNTGADDYVVKPFDNNELIARIQALLRRGGTTGEPILTWGHLSLDPNTRRVAYRDQILALTPKEYAILELFLRHQETVFRARAILDKAWNSIESPGEEVVRCHIKDLRQKLTAVGAPKDLIKTVYRVGYRLNPLYAASTPVPGDRSLTAPQVAELCSVNEELRVAMEELQVAMEQLQSTQAELKQKNQELQSARDELEQRVAERTTDLQALYNQAPCGYHSLDAEGRIVQINETELRMFGYAREEMLGRKITDFYTPEGLQTFQENYPKFIQQGWVNDLEFTVIRKDGSRLPISLSATAIKDTAGNFLMSRSIVIDISDRRQVAAKLRESEQQYRSLFESIDQGFCLLEVLFDANDKAIDYRFVEINHAFEQQSGLVNAIGKTILELVPNLEPQWAELYGQVAKSGEAVRFEADVPSMNRIFDIYAFPSGTPGQNLVAVLFADITQRKQAEEILRQTAELDAFRVSLADALRLSTDVSEIQAIAARILGEALQATRVIYIEVVSEGEEVIVHRNYTNGVAELSGRYCLEDYRRNLIVDHPDGHPQVVTDIPNNLRYTDAEKARYHELDIAAHIDVPLIKNNQFVALLSVQQSKPRQWTETEIKLAEETAERTWAAVERAYAEAALHQNEEILRLALAGAHAGTWDWELATGQLTWSPDTYQLYGLDLSASPPNYSDWYENSLHPDDRTWVNHYVNQMIAQRQPDFQLEFRILHPQHGIRWILSLGHLIVNEQGEPVRLSGINLDISDRKQATFALQQSEAKFRHFAENSHAVIWIADPTSLNCTYVSPAYEAIWGRSCQSLLDTPQSWLDAIHPDERDQVEATLHQKRKERTSSVEYRIVRPDGTIRWIQDRGFTVCDEKGQVYSYAGIAEDISDRKQAELTLQKQIQQEYLLNDIAQEIRRSLQLNDVLSSTVHRVRAFLEVDRVVIFRFRPNWQGEVIMESVGDEWTSILSTNIFDPCFRDHYIEPYRQGRVATMSDIVAADLEPCYAELLQQFQVKANLVVPILQNNHLWGLLIAHHCTAPRQWTPTEIALLKRLATQVGIAIQQSELYQQLQRELDDRQEAEQKIREQAALLDISTDAILVCDLDCRILYWNQGAKHLYGWQAEEVLGQKANELLLRSPSAFVEMKQTVLEQGTWHGEIQRFTKTGKEVTVEGRCTLVRDEAGQPKSILSVDTDITEKKSLEAQFYQAQRLESLGTLTSGIAHDLNNALTPILSIAQLLRMKQSGLDARSKEMLQVLEESAQRGANMVKQILTFTRGTGGEKTAVDVASLLQEVVKVAQQTFPKSISIHAIVSPEGIRQVSADATQLHQVVMNLCVNARDAMPTGGTLTLSVENFDANEIFAQINMDAHVGQYVLITVTDTGTGIAPEVRDRIFDPFFTTKAIGQGTGLGLSTVLGIVRSYGGFIQVVSKVGKGTQFKIYLPAVETGAASSLQETALPQGQGELILVVDDESPILQSTRAILETHHYQVLTATNGTEAIAIYAHHQQDIALVLVDMMMPDMDGITVIRVLQGMNPRVRAIAVSGLLPQYQNSLETLGIATHLNKPYTTEDLLNSIHLQLR